MGEVLPTPRDASLPSDSGSFVGERCPVWGRCGQRVAGTAEDVSEGEG